MSDTTHQHEQVWLLLPWHLNGTLDDDERRRVKTHLGSCLACRQELERMRQYIELGCHEAGPQSTAEHSFSLLMARIRADRPGAVGWLERLRPRFPAYRDKSARAIPVAAAAALALVIGLGVYFQGAGPPATYRTLADAPATIATGPELRAVFDDALSLNALHELLRGCETTISAGPSPVGAYTLRVAGKRDIESVLACLRENESVRFAEKVAAVSANAP